MDSAKYMPDFTAFPSVAYRRLATPEEYAIFCTRSGEELLEDGKQAEIEQWKAFWVDPNSPKKDY